MAPTKITKTPPAPPRRPLSPRDRLSLRLGRSRSRGTYVDMSAIGGAIPWMVLIVLLLGVLSALVLVIVWR